MRWRSDRLNGGQKGLHVKNSREQNLAERPVLLPFKPLPTLSTRWSSLCPWCYRLQQAPGSSLNADRSGLTPIRY
jgi:hypothetical protein